MRLHSLELTAFGPYARAQRIDFGRLSSSGLFLLEGGGIPRPGSPPRAATPGRGSPGWSLGGLAGSDTSTFAGSGGGARPAACPV
jgi:hypothetical protein